MTPEAWQRVKAVFDVALSLPPTERPSFLDSVCGADVALRTEVESLLSAASGAGSFLGTPPQTVTSPVDHPRSVVSPGQMIGRYRVLSHLGAGGMGEVYLAQDPRLGRRIALKLLPRELSHDPARLQRFEREARAASQLAHPNVCVIHEIEDTADERRFIAMEYVEGESLRQVLERHRAAGTRMPLDEALDIALQVAAGLGAAHAAGIVHRDVKPENVMRRPDGLVKVLDFGLAKLVEASAPGSARPGSSSVQTEAGTVLGTVLYMSPEQARALPLDARTDVWSLGVVLYELLAGQPPFEGDTAADVMVSILDRQPPMLTALVPELPGEIQSVIERALQKEPEARYPSMREFASGLTGLPQGKALDTGTRPQPRSRAQPWWRRPRTAVVLSVVLAGVAVFGVWSALGGPGVGAGAEGAPGVMQLAVLPFENLGDSADERFAAGMSDAVRGKLGPLRGLQVIPRESTIQRKDTTNPQEIGQELRVQYLLMGTVRWQKVEDGTSRVQVTSKLFQAMPTATIWQQTFDVPLSGVFKVQADIARRVARALNVALDDSARRQLAEQPTQNLDAYDAYLKGEEVRGLGSVSDPAALRRAAAYYWQAVALDSGFVQAWARLSEARSRLNFRDVTLREVVQARQAAERAVALAPHRAEGHVAMALYYSRVSKDQTRANEELVQALRSAPNDIEVLQSVASFEQAFGRWEAALAHLQNARMFAPSDPSIAASLAWNLLYLRRYRQAWEAAESAIALDIHDLDMIRCKTMIALAQGNLARAREVLATGFGEENTSKMVETVGLVWGLAWVLDSAHQKLLEVSRGVNTWDLWLTQTYWLRGEHGKARASAEAERIWLVEALRSSRNFQLGNDSSGVAHVLVGLGLSLAYLGRKTEALREFHRGLELLPIVMTASPELRLDGFVVPDFQYKRARIHILLGEPDMALDQLQLLLKSPHYLSPGWLEVDPTFGPLRENPRFQGLVGGNDLGEVPRNSTRP
jgi:TolB-like protein/Tfp pilus assembly protein PilF